MTTRLFSLIAILLIAGCGEREATPEPAAEPEAEAPEVTLLASGLWTGDLTPMNHPDMSTPLQFQVSHTEDALDIIIEGPGDMRLRTRGTRIEGDTLRFNFIEPEAMVSLRCALGGAAETGYQGRCQDNTGQWAQVRMLPPQG